MVTALGGLTINKTNNNIIDINPYVTDINHEGCSLCCCFPDNTLESYYKFDQVYQQWLSRYEVIK